MLKKDYFLAALRAGRYTSREWILRCFSTVMDPSSDSLWDLEQRNDGVFVKVPNDDNDKVGQWVKLEDVEPYQIPFIYHESSGPLNEGDILNVDRYIKESTWGVVLTNAVVLVYACGNKIPFMEGPFSPKDIEKIFLKEMRDNPKPDEQPDSKTLYVNDWLKVGRAVGFLDGFEIFIPSITEKSLQPYPELKTDKAKLLAQYTEEELRDPVIQSKIQDELVANHKAYLKGDVSEGFIFKDKTYNTAMKRMFLIHGPEAGFSQGGQATLVPNSLDDGIDPKYFPDMVNSLRAGSYFRGAMTALAGTDVDLMARIFQNSKVQEGSCGTKEVLKDVVVTERYLGRWMRINGNIKQLTEKNFDEHKGKRHDFFDPCYCKADENDICSVCIGGNLANYPTSLGSAVAEKQSVLMYVMMSAAHSKELKTKKLLPNWLS